MICVCTSGFTGFEQHSDQFWDVKVSGVVQGVHVGPAAPQTHVGAQSDQLAAETQRGRRVACTHNQVRTKRGSSFTAAEEWNPPPARHGPASLTHFTLISDLSPSSGPQHEVSPFCPVKEVIFVGGFI